MSNRGGLRLGFGGKRTKRAAKKSEGTHLTPRKDEPLTVRCAKSLAEALSEQSDDCLLYTSPSPRDYAASRMPSSA